MTRDRWIAALIGGLVTGVTLACSSGQGITRDEAYYMEAGERYVRYYEDVLTGRLSQPFASPTIARYWGYNAEHPPLMKVLYGVSWRVGHGALSLMPEVTAFRLPTAAAFGLLCALIYLFFVTALGSRRGALAAALLMFAQPRAFFHAQTAAFDLPAAALWLAVTLAYWRALGSESWRAAIATGLVFGLFLSTKLQSFLLPLALLAHWAGLALVRRAEGRRGPTLRPLVMMGALGPVVMLALWPWLWHHTLARLRVYLDFHWRHPHYHFEYLGRSYDHPPYPWHEPLGMLLLTAPIVLLALAAAGTALLCRPSSPLRAGADDRSTRALLLFAGGPPVAIFVLGALPIYGETKHWLATMPFLALCAGYAVDRLGAGLERECGLGGDGWRQTATSALLILLAVAPAAVETWRSHPYGLSYYNALAGGAPGGADLGMNRQYWGYSVKGVLPWLNANLRPGARLFLHDANHEAYERYVRARQLRPDIVDAGGLSATEAALVVHEKHFAAVDYAIWEAYGHVGPAEVLTLDGVPLVSVYVRDAAATTRHRAPMTR